MNKGSGKKTFRGVEIFLFMAYLIILCYFLFVADRLGRTYADRTYHYNLVPLKEIRRFWTYRHTLDPWSVALNLAGNVVAFIPFGAFLPQLFEKCRNFWLTMIFCFEFSLCVEIIQLVWKVGSFDVDDILLNTFGGILGFFIFRISRCLIKDKRMGEGDQELKSNPDCHGGQGEKNEEKKS